MAWSLLSSSWCALKLLGLGVAWSFACSSSWCALKLSVVLGLVVAWSFACSSSWMWLELLPGPLMCYCTHSSRECCASGVDITRIILLLLWAQRLTNKLYSTYESASDQAP